jgi:hypothetical protein
MTSTHSFSADRSGQRSLFDWINVELDPGICDKLSLVEGYSTDTVHARYTGA